MEPDGAYASTRATRLVATSLVPTPTPPGPGERHGKTRARPKHPSVETVDVAVVRGHARNAVAVAPGQARSIAVGPVDAVDSGLREADGNRPLPLKLQVSKAIFVLGSTASLQVSLLGVHLPADVVQNQIGLGGLAEVAGALNSSVFHGFQWVDLGVGYLPCHWPRPRCSTPLPLPLLRPHYVLFTTHTD